MKARDTTSKLDWENLRFFLAVARTGSLSRAARILHTDHSTVRRRVEILEQQIGAQLFYRHPRGYDLTSTAERIVEWVQRMDVGASGMESALKNRPTAPTSVVRLRSSLIVSESLVRSFAPVAPALLPSVLLDLVSDDEEVGLPKGPTEVTLRCGRPQGFALDVQRLGQLPLGLFCSSDYLHAHVEPRQTSDLSGHRFLDWRTLAVQAVYAHLEQQGANRQTVLVSDSLEVLSKSASCGAGIALLPLLEAGPNLVRLLPDFTFGPLDIYAICLPDWHKSWAVRSVVEFVQERAEHYLTKY